MYTQKPFFSPIADQKNAPKAFTLIELLVVIAIIGLLSSVVLASLSGARESARDTRRKADLSQLRTAFNLYYNKFGTYIGEGSGCGIDGNGNGWLFSENDTYDYQRKISDCLEDGGYVSGSISDPSGQTSGGAPADVHTYMKYGCDKGVFLYANLESIPKSSDALPSEVCKSGGASGGIDHRYGMDYYLQVD